MAKGPVSGRSEGFGLPTAGLIHRPSQVRELCPAEPAQTFRRIVLELRP